MKSLRTTRLGKGRYTIRKITLALSLLVASSQLGCAEPVVDFHHACSKDASTHAKIEFVNNSATAITTYWLDYGFREVEYSVLAPGTSYTQDTYVSHPWVIRDTATGTLLMDVPAPTAPAPSSSPTPETPGLATRTCSRRQFATRTAGVRSERLPA